MAAPENDAKSSETEVAKPEQPEGKPSPTKKETDIMTQAMHHLASGKRNLAVQDVNAAVTSLESACKLLGEQYGEVANECGEAYFYYGKALLEMARLESGVLANAFDGVPNEEDTDVSNIEDESLTEEDIEKTKEEVNEALAENFNTLKEKVNGHSKEAKTASPKANEEMELSFNDAEADVAVKEMSKEESKPKKDDESSEGKENVEPNEEAAKVKEPSTKNEEVVKENKPETKKEDAVKEKEASVTKNDESPVEEKNEKPEEPKKIEGKKEESEENSEEDDEEEAKPDEEEKKEGEDTESDEKEEGDKEDEENAAESGEGEEKETESIGSNDAGTSDGKDKKDATEIEQEEVDDPSNLQLAWEMFELSKTIFKRHADSLEAADAKRLDLENRLSETYQLLGEVSIENENYPQAIEDLTSCLRRRQEFLPEDSREVAVTHYQLGVAQGFNLEFDAAVSSLNDAIHVLETRIKNLQNGKASADPTKQKDAFYTSEREIEEIKGLLPEIKEKITDTLDMKEETLKKIQGRRDEEMGMSESNGAEISSSSTNGEKSKPVSNISHLIKKRKKSEEDASGDAKKPHLETNGSANGSTTA